MMIGFKFTLFILFLVHPIKPWDTSGIPETIHYQGVLTSNDGNPVENGSYSFSVSIYNAESSGEALWTETQTVEVINGLFNIHLGSIEPLNLNFDTPCWIGMSVDGGDELNPRIPLGSVPYAFHAHSVPDGSITSSKLADESVTQEKIHPGVSLPVTGEAGGDLTGSFPDPEIADGAVTAEKLSDSYILSDGVSDATDGFAITGTIDEGSIPIDGAGTRLMWYPGKAAFRVGIVSGSQWDDGNIGLRSVAIGDNTTASGLGSTAMGSFTTAGGLWSTAMGNGSIAAGDESTAMGSFTTAGGLWSTAMGNGSIAAGRSSVAMGLGTRAFANQMVAIGRYNAPTGVTGSTASDRPAFVVGNGTSDTNRSHALLLLANGDLRITGPMRVGSFPFSTGTGVCRTTNGTLANCSSSARYKEEIRGLDLQASAALVREMRPVSFRWQESGLEDIGLIAEELAGIEPRLVIYDADGEIEGIKYNHLSALLVAAVQDLQTRFGETMKTRQEQFKVLTPRNSTDGHIGPMAQDIYEAFGLGEDKLRINTIDADGIAFAAIQDLNEKLKIKIQQFEEKLITKKRIIIELEKRLSKIEVMLERADTY